MAVSPVPPGFSTITPHLIIRGAGDAISFYQKAFGAEEHVRMPGPDGKSVMHAELKIGDSMLFLADEFPGMPNASPQNLGGTTVTIHLYVENADAWFNRAVAAGAKVSMPLMNMFWGDRFGKVTDPFGHDWSIAQHIEDVSGEECARRSAEPMKEFCKK